MSPYRIVLADDHVMFRQGIKRILERENGLEVVGEVGDGLKLLDLVKNSPPDMVILDISMPSLRGIEATREIKSANSEVKVLVLTMHKDKQYVASLPKGKAGGWSYLLKQSVDDIPALVRGIEGSAAGFMVLDPAIVDGLRPAPGSVIDKLTPRHRELLELMAKGYSNASIADKLAITKKAVENI